MGICALNLPNTPLVVLAPQTRHRVMLECLSCELTPAWIKVSIAALAALAMLAVWSAIGSVLFNLALIHVSLILGVASLKQQQHAQDLERHISSLEISRLFGETDYAIGARWVELDLGDRESDSGDINFIGLDELDFPRQGVDKYGRKFYAIKIEENLTQTPHVLIVFQKYTTGDLWHVSGPQGFGSGPLTQQMREEIERIMVDEGSCYNCLNFAIDEPD